MPKDEVTRFTNEIPSIDSYWRSIVLFGRNVASYKFALAGALLEIGDGDELVSLETLALPYATRIASHLQTHDKQGTFQKSRFIDACRAYNRGDLDEEGLRAGTVKLGFANVIDAFHVVDEGRLPERFFIDERASHRALRLTDVMRSLIANSDDGSLRVEVEARWRLVETAWELNLPRSLLMVGYEPKNATLIEPRRRTAITGARGALNGYQKGFCFYCFRSISVVPGSVSCEVDHLFAWSTGPIVGGAPVDGVWNLVLACPECNSWHEKGSRPPALHYVERLHRRNEFLISSHHPLRPTVIAQTGATETARRATLQAAYDQASFQGVRQFWTAPDEGPATF